MRTLHGDPKWDLVIRHSIQVSYANKIKPRHANRFNCHFAIYLSFINEIP
jgi:hypothetical protein